MKATTVRKGMVILFKKEPCRIMDYSHVTPGNYQAVVHLKLRNLLTGNKTEARFNSSEDVEIADVYSTRATYLYKEADKYVFMDSNSYEQIYLNDETLGDDINYLMENMEVGVTLFNGNPIGIELPSSVVLTVVETTPDVRGATATNVPKPAKMETGLQVSVPSFIKEGEKLIINTTDGAYVGRADK